MTHRCAIIFVLLGSLLLSQPASATLELGKPSLAVQSWAARPRLSSVESNLPVNLTGENSTPLGGATTLTASLASGTTLPITYTLEFGDETPAATGVWTAHSVLTFTHVYTSPASYTVILTTNGKEGMASVATILRVVDNSLQGDLVSVTAGRLISYTLIVTNTSAVLPAANVILWGSVPDKARLANAGNALAYSNGGDYGTGFAKSAAPVTLPPGQSTQLTWAVEVIWPRDAVLTRGHATSDRSTIDLDAVNQVYHLFLPALRRDTRLLN